MLCGDVYEKLHSSGKVWHQVSWRPRDCLQAQRATVVGLLSFLAGVWSSGSSTMLKLPVIICGEGRSLADHCATTSGQKCVCWARSFGVYTLMRCRVSPITLPAIRVVNLMSFKSSFSLLITNAMPAELDRFTGSGELKRANHLEKSCCTCIVSLAERCVSWRARMPICRDCSAFVTMVHLDIGPVPVSGEERPLILRDAILMLAQWLLFSLGQFCLDLCLFISVGG